MNLARLIDALRARPAVLVAVALVLVCLFGFTGAFRPRRVTSNAPLYTDTAQPTVVTLERETVPVKPVAPAPKPPPTPAPQPTPPPQPPPPVVVVKTNRPLPTLSIHVKLPPETNLPPLGIYAPAGRLLRCELVNTVDSANTDTPMIALVTDDLWHAGHLVIPAGTEVHSRVRVDRLRERIVATGMWVLVWQSGEELAVRGVALDRAEHADGQTWDLNDGIAGLPGQLIHTDPLAEGKLFGATFLSGMASGLQQTRETVLGTQLAGNIHNAALGGASQVLNSYAQQVLETMKQDGIYVRVAGGKQMYLYITDTIDLSQARIGNLRVASHPTAISFPNLNQNTNPNTHTNTNPTL